MPEEPPKAPQSAELVLIILFVRAYLQSGSKRRRAAFMDMADKIAEVLERRVAATPIRRSRQQSDAEIAMREALAAYRSVRPMLLA